MSHTPGPWTRDEADDYVGADETMVATTFINVLHHGTGVAIVFEKPEDVQLAFSAPDLLAACEAAMSLLGSMPTPANEVHAGESPKMVVVNQLFHAIAKARGAK